MLYNADIEIEAETLQRTPAGFLKPDRGSRQSFKVTLRPVKNKELVLGDRGNTLEELIDVFIDGETDFNGLIHWNNNKYEIRERDYIVEHHITKYKGVRTDVRHR